MEFRKNLSIIVSAVLMILNIGCKERTTMNTNKEKVQAIFPKGELGPAENFTGNAWNTSLVAK